MDDFQLTDRQEQILLAVADGMKNVEVAAELVISMETVKGHMQSLCRRFGARNRTHLIALAYHRGYLKPKEGRKNMPAPDLSHYYGRRVEDIRKGTGAEGEPAWSLVLEGGVVVQNYDESLPVPGAHIKGQRFTNMTLHAKVTSMFFGGLGGNTVSLNPMKYAIASDVTETPYYPQVSEANEHWTPPPPEGRDAEKPEDFPDVETQ